MQRSRRKLWSIPPSSAGEEQAVPVAKARSAKRATKRSAPSGIAAPLPKRQCQAELQATMSAHIEEFAGRLAALEVSGVAPTPTPCSSSPAMLGTPAASRNHAAQRYTRLALCLEPARPSVASVSLPSRFAQSHRKPMCFPANLSTPSKYSQNWLAVLDRSRGCSNSTAARFRSQRLGAEAVRQELHILQTLAV